MYTSFLLCVMLHVQGEVSVIGSRCRVRGGNPVCPVDIEDPMSSIENVINVRTNMAAHI